MSGVLITGANGNVGARLAKEYLDHSDAPLYLLVRGNDQAHAQARLATALAFWDIDLEQQSDRITVLQGDITAPELGLSAVTITEIKRHVSRVIHAASAIRLDLSLEQARQMILTGTRNVFALAQSLPNLQRFGFCSTMEVIGDYREVVREEWLTDYPRGFLNTYEIAKAEAEEFLRQEVENGAPVTVFRLSMVVGEAQTGKAMEFQSFYMMLEKMLLKPDYPILPSGCPIDTIPVDVLAEAIRRLMAYPQANGQIYHLSQGLADRLPFRAFIDKAKPIAEAKLGRRIRRPVYISPSIFIVFLNVLHALSFGKLKRFFRIQLLFIKFLQLEWQFDRSNTEATLTALGMDLPKFDTYFPQLMDYYFAERHRNRLPF